ncbi:hypothetical protein F4778DRAFT_786134 [Xylariomycetidae sp. FL2044]|nr:hypothetical protein F4778DRAFT_786134 [Xylariomycetidae sp. FL2044]
MAKETSKGAESAAEKPLPLPKRPGTSGTENLLITNRRQASENFARAQRAEKAYRAKKHASLARQRLDETKGHFREALSHLKQGFGGLLSVVKAVPYLVGEKREARRRKAEARRRQRHLEQKKKLEEELARQSTTSTDEDEAEEADGEKTKEKK